MSHVENIARGLLSANPITSKEIIPFEFDKIIVTTIIDDKGNPWWVAKVVCDVLGYVNSSKFVADHCKNSQKIKGVTNRYSLAGHRL